VIEIAPQSRVLYVLGENSATASSDIGAAEMQRNWNIVCDKMILIGASKRMGKQHHIKAEQHVRARIQSS
jgi:hypothetical protein